MGSAVGRNFGLTKNRTLGGREPRTECGKRRAEAVMLAKWERVWYDKNVMEVNKKWARVRKKWGGGAP